MLVLTAVANIPSYVVELGNEPELAKLNLSLFPLPCKSIVPEPDILLEPVDKLPPKLGEVSSDTLFKIVVGLNVEESQPLPIIKKPRTEGPISTAPIDDYSKGRKVEPSQKSKLPLTSSKLKAASKARAGTKSIASFFGPPPKK